MRLAPVHSFAAEGGFPGAVSGDRERQCRDQHECKSDRL